MFTRPSFQRPVYEAVYAHVARREADVYVPP